MSQAPSQGIDASQDPQARAAPLSAQKSDTALFNACGTHSPAAHVNPQLIWNMRRHFVKPHYRKITTKFGNTRWVRVKGHIRGQPGLLTSIAIALLALVGFLVEGEISKRGQNRGATSSGVEIEKRPATDTSNAVKTSSNLWNHNSSIVRLEAFGNVRRFYYVEPRQGLPASSGGMVFEGATDGFIYSGRAFLFSADCGPIGYPVTGTINPDRTTLTMRGKRPRRDALCSVMGYVNDEFVFSSLR